MTREQLLELHEEVCLREREIIKAKKGAELGVYGVDMMVGGEFHGTEYGYQRPSCEVFLGYAAGLGIEVTLPDESDLLAAAFDYGDERANAFRNKVVQARSMYSQRHGELESQGMQIQIACAEARGSRNALDGLMANWLPGDHGNEFGMTPQPHMNIVPTNQAA